MKCIYLIACEKALREQETEDVSLIGILTYLYADYSGEAYNLSPLYIAVLLEKEESDELECNIIIEARINDHVIGYNEFTLDFEGFKRYSYIFSVGKTPLTESGRLFFTLTYNDKRIGEWGVVVNLRKATDEEDAVV